MTLGELEKAIAKLSPEDSAAFREWFRAFDEEEWDRQIARNAKEGWLDRCAEEAIADYKAGRMKEL